MKLITTRYNAVVLAGVVFFALSAMPASAAPAVPEKAGQSLSQASSRVSLESSPQTPTVTMGDWRNSTTEERYSFLAGFCTMLELERAWQGENPLSIKQSLIGSWADGLSGVSIREMDDAVTNQLQSEETSDDRLVVDFLWYHFVQPKISKALGKTQP